MQFFNKAAEKVMATEGIAKRAADEAEVKATKIFAASDEAYRTTGLGAMPGTAMQVQHVGSAVGAAGAADPSSYAASAGASARSEFEVAEDRIFAAISGMPHQQPLM